MDWTLKCERRIVTSTARRMAREGKQLQGHPLRSCSFRKSISALKMCVSTIKTIHQTIIIIITTKIKHFWRDMFCAGKKYNQYYKLAWEPSASEQFIVFLIHRERQKSNFSVCLFCIKVSSFVFVMNWCELFSILLMDLYNDLRKSKDNELQADVWRLHKNAVLYNLSSDWSKKRFGICLSL